MTSKKTDLSQILWNDSSPRNDYSSEEQYRQHVLEQYKIYLELADRVSSRRDVANSFFLTLNGAIVASLGYLIEKQTNLLSEWWMVLFPLFVLLLQCFFWWRLINSYRQLNGAKFQIVGEFESRLPASPYKKAEWDSLLEEGKNCKVYWPLTHLESKIPVMFGITYLIATSIFIYLRYFKT